MFGVYSTRLMEVRGVHYAWAPIDGFICVSVP
jgi:hypothetical protein